MPVYGADTQWFQNVVVNPAVRIRADGQELTASARPITDPDQVNRIVDAFRAKYGDDVFEQYYPKHDVAVEVPLS